MKQKFNWYNLPAEINKVIKPYTSTKVYWYNLPMSLDKVYKEILLLKPSCNTTKKFQWYCLNKKAKVIFELVDCVSSNEINFDVTSSDWGSITDANSLKTALEFQSGETTNTISNFSLIEGRLRCNITNIMEMYLNSFNITNIEEISISGLTRLGLQSNQITNFNPTIPLPSSLEDLDLALNQITDFNPTIPLPSSLLSLGLNSNQITDFNPTIPLPSSLQFLGLGSNQITNFNPTIPLPSTLQIIQLALNQIVTFNPTIPLPSSLRTLELNLNQIVTFNPTIPLPSSLLSLDLQSNQMTTQGYINSEPWANAANTGSGEIKFGNNVNSASGTNLVFILQSKGYTVLV